MWNRKDVKAKGLKAFKANFWKCVATLILVGAIAGGTAAYTGGYNTSRTIIGNHRIVETTDMDQEEIDELMGETEEELDQDTGFDASIENDFEAMTEQFDEEEVPAFVIVAASIIVSIVMLAVAAIAIVFNALIVNPVKLGCARFFRRNLEDPASMDNLMFGFRNHYKNVAKTMFLKDLYISLWTLLFIVPGIVKSYEYRLVDYILSENPEMNTDEALKLSASLMKGNKWKTFVLDLSFIGWDILSAATCGILGVFYVEPYKKSTDAALYEAIKYDTAKA